MTYSVKVNVNARCGFLQKSRTKVNKMSEYNRRVDGTFKTPDKVTYHCDKCGHVHEGFEIMGMKIVCPKCGDSWKVGDY